VEGSGLATSGRTGGARRGGSTRHGYANNAERGGGRTGHSLGEREGRTPSRKKNREESGKRREKGRVDEPIPWRERAPGGQRGSTVSFGMARALRMVAREGEKSEEPHGVAKGLTSMAWTRSWQRFPIQARSRRRSAPLGRGAREEVEAAPWRAGPRPQRLGEHACASCGRGGWGRRRRKNLGGAGPARLTGLRTAGRASEPRGGGTAWAEEVGRARRLPGEGAAGSRAGLGGEGEKQVGPPSRPDRRRS
jgi:hypothetical protein